ncbi:MAG: Gmad2 immunoglobulin-like domain-containing protein [Nocardioides sp.]
MTLHRLRTLFLTPLLTPTLVLTVGLGLLAGCGSDDVTPVASDPQQTPSATADVAPKTTPAEPERTEPTEPAGSRSETVAAPIYFVGDSPTGPRLYREFRQVEADNPLMEGAALLLGGDVLDPDYYTLLPSLDITGIETVDGAIVVSLGSDSPTADKSSSPKLSRIAVQSLVYTLQGIAQTREPVRVVMGDQPVALLGQPTDTGVAARDPLKVLALVNVTGPASGAEVSGTLAASGVASSFEATVLWEIRDADGAVVLDGFATAEGFMDRLYPWETDIDISSLAAGSYTFAALTSDPSAGEGPGPYEDTKTIAVG